MRLFGFLVLFQSLEQTLGSRLSSPVTGREEQLQTLYKTYATTQIRHFLYYCEDWYPECDTAAEW